jgi:hypothetical protein
MIKKIPYTHCPMAQEIKNEIDRDLITKMITIAGGDPKDIDLPSFDELSSNENLISIIACQTPYRILAVDIIDDGWNIEYEITFDDSIRSTRAENKAVVELEFIANSI